LRDDALLCKHLCMGDAAKNVMAIKPRVDLNGGGKSLGGQRRPAGKTTAPEFLIFGCQVFSHPLHRDFYNRLPPSRSPAQAGRETSRKPDIETGNKQNSNRDNSEHPAR